MRSDAGSCDLDVGRIAALLLSALDHWAYSVKSQGEWLSRCTTVPWRSHAVGLKDSDLRIAREMKYTRKRTGSRISRRRNSIYAGGYRRMAVSYECEQCNSPRVPPSAGSVSSKRRAFARLPSLVPKPRAHGGTANFALECESELDGRGTAPHVSSDQDLDMAS